MKSNQKDVKQFMLAAGQDCPDKIRIPPFKVRKLRVQLLLEEVLELAEASGVGIFLSTNVLQIKHSNDFLYSEDKKDEDVDVVEVVDALCDIEYVNQGAGVAYGVDLEEPWNEVQRSNMSKFIDGHENPSTGKWIKGPSYSPADLKTVLNKQA